MTRIQRWMPFIFVTLVVGGVLAFFTAVTPTHAQTTATITADHESITVGDPVILTVSVSHPTGSVVLFPELEATWGDFIVRSQSAPQTVENGDGSAPSGLGYAVTTQQMDVRLFAPGDFQTPSLPITISDSAGNLTETLAAPFALTVQSVLVEGDTDLRDIKPQADLPLPAIWPYLVSAFVATVLSVAFVAYRRRKGKVVVDNRLPHEKALDALVAIDKQGYAANGRYKEQYAAVSDTLRTYFETISKVPFTDRTTAEIRYDLAGGPLPLADAQRLLLLLEDADLVKFAKVTPSQHEAERLTQDARQLVLDTKPEIIEPTSRKPKSNKRVRRTNYAKQETTI